ncbi:MAG: hypothetical protein V1753_10165 [Pseudomonadota bacterium]
MKTLIGGAAAAVLGIIGITLWYDKFFMVMAGSIPVFLLLGGGLAIYLGYDELKDTWKSKKEEVDQAPKGEDVEKYKKEVEDLKKEVEQLKEKKCSTSASSEE